MKKHFIILFTFFYVILPTYAYNLRQITNLDGLSNSSITCLCQNREHFLYIGTYDGLNIYNSRDIYVYKPNANEQKSLSSNVIKSIIETDNEYLWISTKGGLNKFSLQKNTIEEYYNHIYENSFIAKDSNDNIYVLHNPQTLSTYLKKEKKFIELPVNSPINYNTVKGMVIDAQDTLWINHQGILEKYTVHNAGTAQASITRHKDFCHPYPIVYIFKTTKGIIAINSIHEIWLISSKGNRLIKKLPQLFSKNGEIGSIIFDNQNLLIGFKTNGLICLNAQKNYEPEQININCGVFSLCKDEQQDIIWIGTDGQGIYAYTKDTYTFTNVLLSELPITKKRPIRAIYTDKEERLWLGTKDNGIIRLDKYNSSQSFTKHITHFTTKEGLQNNAVFAFEPSTSYPLLWIASDGPELNFFSYKDNRLHTLVNKTGQRIAQVHAINETSDSLLWVGSGSILLRISFKPDDNES